MNLDKVHNRYKILIVACSLILTLAVCHTFVVNIGIPADWTTYRLASRALVEGRSPYDLDNDYQFYNPPWALLPLIPFAYLSYPYDSIGILVLGLVGVVGFCYWVGIPGKNALVWLTTPPIIGGVIVGQIDWMVLFGFTSQCPDSLAYFFLLIKPQVGLGVAIYRFIESCRTRGVLRALYDAFPAVGCLVLSFFIYGFWPLNCVAMAERESTMWYTTLWPQALVAGIPLLYLALSKRNMRYAMVAAPCLSNHVLPSSWMGALLALEHKPKLLAVVSISMWAVMILHAFNIL